MTDTLPFAAPAHGYLTLRLDALNSMAKELAGRRHETTLGLTLREVRILLIVRENPGISIGQLIQRSYLEKTIVSRCVTALARLGWVARNVSEVDTRQFSLSLTKPGQVAATKAAEIATHFIDHMLSVLSARERDVLDTALERMIALMQVEFQGESPHLSVKKARLPSASQEGAGRDDSNGEKRTRARAGHAPR